MKAGGRIKGKSESDSDSAKEFTMTKNERVGKKLESDGSRFGDKSEEEIENKPCISCKGSYKKHWGLR